MRNVARRVRSATLLLSMGACEPSVPNKDIVVRDSTGVRIIESSSPTRFAAPITIGDRPSFAVGQVEGDPRYLLTRVVGAMQLAGGNVLIANGGTNELRFYDSHGELVHTEGGEGQGPGEYEYLRALGRCREEGFVAFDLNWQMNQYGPEGQFLEKTVLRAPDGITPYNLACDPRGHFLILGWGRAATEGSRVGFYQARDNLVLTSIEGEIATDFGERLVSERIGSTRGSRPHPAGRATLFAIQGDLVYVGSGERFEIELHDLSGALRTVVRGPAIPLQTTDSVKAAYLAWAVSRISPERQPAVRSEVAGWEWPETLPAFTQLIVDTEGVAWLRAFKIDPSEPEVWSLMDPDRGYLGDVTLGEAQTLLEVSGDYALLLQRDALDVEQVLRVTLDRGVG